ncbi:FMN-binding negative transcriptional regulator [Sphingomonas sp. GC_Shp_6]|uniref:FMN-binding negative transcriptional regulator n=1 Tax=Sphingomonas sp. GC_Shp_6 TaxID=2937378 RepID=UPI00226A04E4|nr:FMN-binding negative transcriptional regulator [Sphingomonas sp. GC_Shp_6]
MHPSSAFRAPDDAALLDMVAATGFAHVFTTTSEGPMLVHAPVTHHGDRWRFHVARANRITPHLDGAHVLLSVVPVHGYVSPNWYAPTGDQVPTWNYIGIEIEARCMAIDEPALVEQLDRLADVHEPRPAPWTRAKMDAGIFAKMLGGIRGFELEVTALRGTAKLSQNKTAADRIGVVRGLTAAGNGALAETMA